MPQTAGQSGVYEAILCTSVLVKDLWRRARDSNPRYGFPHNALAGRHLQPLGQLSVVVIGCLLYHPRAEWFNMELDSGLGAFVSVAYLGLACGLGAFGMCGDGLVY